MKGREGSKGGAGKIKREGLKVGMSTSLNPPDTAE